MSKRLLTTALLIACPAFSQQVVAPTTEPVGKARGESVGGYNVVNSFETGYRLSLIDGNLGQYRSDVNYRNGLRLLGSNLTVNSREGHGAYFDEVILNTLGLGNDPYQSATLRAQKNGLYRYDMLWRLNEYYNPGLPIAGGQHLLDTRRRLQDHDLTLLPQSKLKFRAGYTRNSQTGPALSTLQLFDPRGDEFPFFSDVRRVRNEYRLGADLDLFGIKLTLLHRWDYFKEDTAYRLEAPSAGNNPTDRTTLSRLTRAEPYHGSNPGWFGNAHAEKRYWAFNGRFTYTGGRRNFILDETAIGIDRIGLARNHQLLVGGSGRRPVTTGDLSLSIFPSSRLTIVNDTSVYSVRIDGNNFYREFDNGTGFGDLLYFQYLGIRTVTNSTDANYRAAKWLGFHAGYRYSTRRIRSIEDQGSRTTRLDGVIAEQDNHTHAGLFGLRLKPIKPLTLTLDAELDRADRPFTPVSERNYHALSGRLQYKLRALQLSAAYRQNYNTNSVALSTHSSRARNYAFDASWAPRAWLSFDAGYTKLHLDTVSGLAFFSGSPRSTLVANRQSLFFSNIHAANLGVHFTVKKRADLYAGYTVTRDTGDGRAFAAQRAADAISAFLEPVQAFPLAYHSPLARLSVPITAKFRWNIGWQFYRYREDFGLFSTLQDYRAHTGYTSILWSF